MDYMAHIIKGALIGTANILPGISGGTLAISMGVYEQLLHALTHLHREPKKSLATLLPYLLGILGGIVGLSFSMEYLFLAWPLQTNLAFLGLIFGGLPGVLKRIRHPQEEDRSPHNLSALSAAFFLTLVIATAMSLVKAGHGAQAVLGGSVFSCCLLFLIGILSAATMVIPGISGSMILMMIGYYQPLLTAVNRTLFSLLTADFPEFFRCSCLLAPFGIGLLAGFYLFALLMETLFARYARITYCGSLGLILASPIGILAGLPSSVFTLPALLTGILCLSTALLFVVWISQAPQSEPG